MHRGFTKDYRMVSVIPCFSFISFVFPFVLSDVSFSFVGDVKCPGRMVGEVVDEPFEEHLKGIR